MSQNCLGKLAIRFLAKGGMEAGVLTLEDVRFNAAGFRGVNCCEGHPVAIREQSTGRK